MTEAETRADYVNKLKEIDDLIIKHLEYLEDTEEHLEGLKMKHMRLRIEYQNWQRTND